jgi:hypothetical protein
LYIRKACEDADAETVYSLFASKWNKKGFAV